MLLFVGRLAMINIQMCHSKMCFPSRWHHEDSSGCTSEGPSRPPQSQNVCLQTSAAQAAMQPR